MVVGVGGAALVGLGCDTSVGLGGGVRVDVGSGTLVVGLGVMTVGGKLGVAVGVGDAGVGVLVRVQAASKHTPRSKAVSANRRDQD